ncbi:MAG: GlsB/YeaQ/YmgE family stress response membrane protein [Gaiellaceae bacterium]
MLGTVIAIMVSAFVTGGLARLAVPGPDPMPAWLTVSIGLVGSVVGGAIAAVASHRDPFAVSLGSFFTAVLLVVAYRRFVQKRPILGPEALRFPRRGVGVRAYRERLQRAGVDPDKLLDNALDRRQHGGKHEVDHEHDDSEEDE